MLAHKFISVSKQLFKNQVHKAKFRDKHFNYYSEEVKDCNEIALLFPKAYDFFCKVLLLPHPASVRP